MFGDAVDFFEDAVFPFGSICFQSRFRPFEFQKTTMLKEINVHAGAVDVGSEFLHAAVYNGPLQVFSTFTGQLYEMAKFFKEHGVTNVAREATGVYWIAPYDVLEQAG